MISLSGLPRAGPRKAENVTLPPIGAWRCEEAQANEVMAEARSFATSRVRQRSLRRSKTLPRA